MARKMSTYEKFAIADILIRWTISLIKAAIYCLSGLGLMWLVESIFKLGLGLLEFVFSSGIVTGVIYLILYLVFKDWNIVRKWNYATGGVLLLISAIINSLSSQSTSTIFVTATTVNIRPCPSTTNCKPIGSAHRGQQFEVLGTQGAFYLIKYGNGTAYITSSPQFTQMR
jgi:hypothetical protein